MARPLRLEFSGAVYHITARGNARQPIVADDTDRQRLVDALAREVTRQNWHCSRRKTLTPSTGRVMAVISPTLCLIRMASMTSAF